MTDTTKNAIENIQNYRSESPAKTDTTYTPTLSSYAQNMPVAAYSMWTVLAALQDFIGVSSINVMLADSQMLATASQLSATASQNMTNQLTIDNDNIQKDAAGPKGDGNNVDTNQLQADQAQFNKDQAAYSVAVTLYQGAVQQWSQTVQNLSSTISSLTGMASSLVQMAWNAA